MGLDHTSVDSVQIDKSLCEPDPLIFWSEEEWGYNLASHLKCRTASAGVEHVGGSLNS